MRFFHLSDLHIGLKLMNRDLSADQEYILKQIAALAAEHKPDAVRSEERRVGKECM